jgi:hypothetical protein
LTDFSRCRNALDSLGTAKGRVSHVVTNVAGRLRGTPNVTM